MSVLKQLMPGQEAKPTPQVSWTVAICHTLPLMVDGVRSQLAPCHDLIFQQATDSLTAARISLRSSPPSLLLIDEAFGARVIADWLVALRSGCFSDPLKKTSIVVWGVSSPESDSLSLLRLGVHGILRRNADAPEVVACLRSVASGVRWVPFQRSSGDWPQLTARQQRVMEMAEGGLSNKDIARELGISTGTVKIHLRNVFEKTGVHSRHRLALERFSVALNYDSTR